MSTNPLLIAVAERPESRGGWKLVAWGHRDEILDSYRSARTETGWPTLAGELGWIGRGDSGQAAVVRELLTVGHGAADRGRLGELLTGAGIAQVVDVRRYPASRTNPDVRREELERWLPECGIDYRWEPRLGGRRHVPAGEPEPDTWWTVAAFRAYAAHTRTAEFDDALAEVLAGADSRTTAIMCSESVW